MDYPFEGGIQTTMLQHSLEIFPLVRSTVFKKKPTQQKQIPKKPKQTSLYSSYLGRDIMVQKQDRGNFCD